METPSPKKVEEKVPTPVKEAPAAVPTPEPVVEKPREPSPAKVTPPVVTEAKKEEKKEETPKPIVPPVANDNCTPEKKVPSIEVVATKEVKAQSPLQTTTPSPVNNGKSNSTENSTVSPVKAD